MLYSGFSAMMGSINWKDIYAEIHGLEEKTIHDDASGVSDYITVHVSIYNSMSTGTRLFLHTGTKHATSLVI